MAAPVISTDWELYRLSDELRRRYHAEGLWNDETLGPWIDGLLRAHEGQTLRAWSRTHPHQSRLGSLRADARRLAGGLRARGIRAGDVVAIQLPNWAEVAVAIWAASFLGAVVVPIVHFYGPKEVGFIVRESAARALISADRFGSVDFLAGLEGIRADAPALEATVVVGNAPEGALAFTRLLEADPIDVVARVDPDAPALVAYTSGTTAQPKGVIHSHRTLLAGIREPGNGVPDPRPYLTGSPISHCMGMIGGFLYPLFQGSTR